jgi:hypothetical protein
MIPALFLFRNRVSMFQAEWNDDRGETRFLDWLIIPLKSDAPF